MTVPARKPYTVKCNPWSLAPCYAVQRWGLRCRFDLSNLSAVCFVYWYVV